MESFNFDTPLKANPPLNAETLGATFKFLEGVDNLQEVESLWEFLFDHLKIYGVTHLVYRHFSPLGSNDINSAQMHVYGFPEGVFEPHIDQKIYEKDTIEKTVFSQSLPYFWYALDQKYNFPENQTAVLEIMRDHVQSEIFVMPLYGPFNYDGYVHLAFNVSKNMISGAIQKLCQWTCNYTHMRNVQNIVSNQRQEKILSSREREIIQWVARGKSNSIIGEIMGISRHTVDSYLRRIFIKLDTTDRTTAALKAVNIGLITA